MTTGTDDSVRQFRLLASLVEMRANIAGDIIHIAGRRWAIYAAIPVDGNVLVAEYDTAEEARAVLGRLPRV